MTKESDLFAQLRDRADDDAARSVYADALASRGDPRGEFIHVQSALATIAEAAPHRIDLERRELDLVRMHAKTWRSEAGIVPAARVRFVRGSIETLAVPPEELAVMTEGIESLMLTRVPVDENDSSGDLERRATCLQRARIGGLRSLDLQRADLPLEELRAFVSAPEISRLERFAIETPLDVAAATAVLELPALTTLELSGLHHGATPPTVYDTVLEHQRCGQLRAFGIGGWNPTVVFTERLSGIGGQLAQLVLDGDDTWSRGAERALELDWPALKSLRLSRHQLARSTRWSSSLANRIEELELISNDLDAAWVRAFVEQPKPRLRYLQLGVNRLSAAGIEAAIDAVDALPALTELRFSNQRSRATSPLGSELGRIAARPGFARLTALDASNADVTSDAVVELASSPYTQDLRFLSLRASSLDAVAITSLARSPYLRELTTLDLGYSDLDPTAFVTLCESGNLLKLRRLGLGGNRRLDRAALGATRALPCLSVIELGHEAPALERELGVLVESGSELPIVRRHPVRRTSLVPMFELG